VGRADAKTLTIDDLAAAAGTTTRRIRSLQTLGLLPHPTLHGRTGLYDSGHRDRLEAVLHLQRQGFSLESLVLLFDALRAGRALADVLGVAPSGATDGDADSADLYGFAQLQPSRATPRRARALLSVVPTTVWDESQAS
jgi:DNA-binding transcriptional MerR regulator